MEKNMKNKAVILGSNYYIGLSAIRCLGENGVTVVAMDHSKQGSYAFYSKYVSEKVITPHYKKNPEEFIEFLIEFAKAQAFPPVLIPCADPYVEIVDANLDTLKKYYLIPMTKQGLYTEVMDKGSLHKLAKEHGVLVPETIATNEADFEKKVVKMIGFPCIVKPVNSAAFVLIFRKKMFQVENFIELETALKKAKDENLEVIVQRIIPGFDDHMYTYDAYMNDDSQVTHWLTCQKYRQFPINFGASVYTGQKYVQELHDIGSKFFEKIGYKGFGEIEFKKDANTGEYYLIEINVRISNLNNLLYMVGINMPWITYCQLTGNPIQPKSIQYNTGIIFRYTYEDILAIWGYLKTKQYRFKDIFIFFFNKKAYAIWRLNDPKPAFAFFGLMIRKVINKIFK
jgi:predicted ATP-grasp superfamily ATP-dependent carboligase